MKAVEEVRGANLNLVGARCMKIGQHLLGDEEEEGELAISGYWWKTESREGEGSTSIGSSTRGGLHGV